MLFKLEDVKIFLLLSVPAARLGLEVQGNPWILRLPSGRTDPADRGDRALHLLPVEVTGVSAAVALTDDLKAAIRDRNSQRDRALPRVLEGR